MYDTICSIATCVGNSSINVIRVSGNEAINIVNKICSIDISKKEANTINYCLIKNNDEIIDEVLVSIFKSPKTYTTEDIVEINTHGGIICVNKIMELLITNGCRMSEPGEFTKRAFLNGRITLTQAEAVNDLINSTTDIERVQAIKGLDKTLNNEINKLKKDLISLLGNIEVNVDYPEYEDAEVVTTQKIGEVITKISQKISQLVDDSDKGLLIKNGINVSIVGKPNVGKSSILNKLLNEEKAIVTNIKGTTRDVVEGNILVNGIKINLYDTAGIRKTADIVEKIGVQKSIDKIDSSDLILFVLDNSEFDKEDEEIFNKVKDKKVLIIYNKSDLGINKKDILSIYDSIEVSALNGINIELLKNKISSLFKLEEINKERIYLSNTRQIALLKKCDEIINNIKNGINNSLPIDIIEIDVKELWDTLNEIIGQTYRDELLDEIFSKFCLGK